MFYFTWNWNKVTSSAGTRSTIPPYHNAAPGLVQRISSTHYNRWFHGLFSLDKILVFFFLSKNNLFLTLSSKHLLSAAIKLLIVHPPNSSYLRSYILSQLWSVESFLQGDDLCWFILVKQWRLIPRWPLFN